MTYFGVPSASSAPEPPSPPPPELIAGRYRVESELGRGGMAVAYAVHDLAEDRPLALKRLLVGDAAAPTELAPFFEREYHALKQLSHPRVVQVHAFGRDGELPYYTMEWLGGGDLHTLAPLPVGRVCALLADVCSALSLLHSRGFLHRDVTPRNVRCTDDGLAKLIDFGGVTPFGTTRRVVGTPAFCAPETLHGEALDGRADLFALGATAYFALTGRHAYPVRDFRSLRLVWSEHLSPPSQHVDGIPPELDALVLGLLSIDRDARPRTAPEVMERLCAIGGVALREDLVAQQAYLTMPRLQGRDAAVEQLRAKMQRHTRRRARVMSLVGPSGSGRTRLLAHCALEGQLQGMRVARADASDATTDFGVARALAAAALREIPELAAALDDRQREAVADAGGDTAAADAAGIQAALCELLLRAARMRPLLLLVDDALEIDERSAALLSLLATEEGASGLMIVATHPDTRAQPQPVPESLQLCIARAEVVELPPLREAQTAALLASVFGEVPHLAMIAQRMHRISEGNPGALMQLAQHLLDRGVIRFDAGAFTLPAELTPSDLPESVHGALLARIESLSAPARQVAVALAGVEGDGLLVGELRTVLAPESQHLVRDAIDELLGKRIVIDKRLQYLLAGEALRGPLLAGLSADDTRALHRQLATLYAEREHNWNAIRHLVLAGAYDEALARVLPGSRDHAQLSPDRVAEVVCALPPDWQSQLRTLIAYCERTERPRVEAHFVRSTLVGFSAMTAEAGKQDVVALLQQLEHDCGLDIYRALPADTPASERMMAALQGAQERLDRTPEGERVVAPGEALPLLARTVIQAIGVMGPRYDYPFFRDLTAIEPFVSLSPALQVVQWNVEGTRALATGHYHILLARNAAILERMAQDDGAGLDAVAHRFMGLALRYSSSLVSAMFGRPLDDAYMAALDADPIFTINACRIRVLDALCRGDTKRADRLRRKADRMRLRDNLPQMFNGSHLHREYVAYAFAGDLARLKQQLPLLEARARAIPGWAPVLHHARGCYHDLRGATAEALTEMRGGLAGLRAGEHPAYAELAAGEVDALRRLGDSTEALETGLRHLAAVRAVSLGPQMHTLLEAVALAHAAVGAHAEAVVLADETIAVLEDFGADGLVLGGACETRARVALLEGDAAGFEGYAARCATVYRAGRNPLLAARYARLMQQADAQRVRVSSELSDAAAARASTTLHELLTSDFADAPQRRRAMLKSVLGEVGAAHGALYVVQDGAACLSEQVGGLQPPPELDAKVQAVVEQAVGTEDDLTQTCTVAAADLDAVAAGVAGEWRNGAGDGFVPLLLSHLGDEGLEVTGVVVVGPTPAQPRASVELLEGISQALLRFGDATPLSAGD